MRLELKNIGQLSDAIIVLDGITIIAGENNTGKSTVGKALYSIFNSFYNVDRKIKWERKNSILRYLYRLPYRTDSSFFPNSQNLSEQIIDDKSIPELTVAEFADYLSEKLDSQHESEIINTDNESLFTEIAENILDVLKISDRELFNVILERSMSSEFSGQICNYHVRESSEIKLTIKNETVSASFLDNKIDSVKNMIYLLSEAAYIDDPFIIDNEGANRPYFRNSGDIPHRENLKRMLLSKNNHLNHVDEILVARKLEKVFEKINSVCEGELFKNTNSLEYRTANKAERIDIRNVSTGLKTFIILKTLLLTGHIQEKSTIILDEPEIHLHPAWQILFAEIIVLLQKEFDLTVLMNTHSPYFLQAIEVYSKKYETERKCHYYLSEKQGKISVIHDVSNDRAQIYKKLAKPFQLLENESYSDD